VSRSTLELNEASAKAFLEWLFGAGRAKWSRVQPTDIWGFASHYVRGVKPGTGKSRLGYPRRKPRGRIRSDCGKLPSVKFACAGEGFQARSSTSRPLEGKLQKLWQIALEAVMPRPQLFDAFALRISTSKPPAACSPIQISSAASVLWSYDWYLSPPGQGRHRASMFRHPATEHFMARA
jgi:hypothetical protein